MLLTTYLLYVNVMLVESRKYRLELVHTKSAVYRMLGKIDRKSRNEATTWTR